MKPKLSLAYMDVTEHWAEEIVRETGRIAAVFVFDENRHVHCCEFTPSFELHLAGYLAERQVCDRVEMEIAAATEFGVAYVHCWQVQAFRRARLRPHWRGIDPFLPGLAPCTLAFPGVRATEHDAAIEEALEALRLGGYTTT